MAPSFGSNNSRLSQIEQVAKYAQALAQTDSKGGRTVVTPSENLAILYDCPCWDDAYSEALICRFPRCRISIRDAQDKSITGFAILFHLEQQTLSWVWKKPSYWVMALWLLSSLVHTVYLHKTDF